VIHVHSTYSDGQLSIDEIAKIANRQNLDYLILTDHNTLQAKRDGKEGFYGKTLMLIGEEISSADGHYLALRVNEEVPERKDSQWTVDAVSSQRGLGFIAHPFWKRRPWRDLEVRGATGLEIYSAVHDVTEENLLWLGFWTILAGSEFSIIRWLDRPDDSLKLWDEMLARGDRAVAIGSPDAHGLRRFGLRLGPYETMFRLVRNHLLVREVSEAEIYEAISSGHLFIAHDLVADARGFRFAALQGRRVKAVMGDEIPFAPGLELYGYLPSSGEMRLFRDGKLLHEAEGQELWFDLTGPGVYRLEATRKGKPWIYSNPLYVLE
jgi:hypothetical protein